jgi:hypothetical protein
MPPNSIAPEQDACGSLRTVLSSIAEVKQALSLMAGLSFLMLAVHVVAASASSAHFGALWHVYELDMGPPADQGGIPGGTIFPISSPIPALGRDIVVKARRNA